MLFSFIYDQLKWWHLLWLTNTSVG